MIIKKLTKQIGNIFFQNINRTQVNNTKRIFVFSLL